MRTVTFANLFQYLCRYWQRCLCCVLLALGAGAGAALAEAPAAAPAATSYRVVRLDSDRYAVAHLNARGQAAVNMLRNGRSSVLFYDGLGFRNFGTLGGTSATVADLNDRGQIAFNVERNGSTRAMFYDGRRVVDIGTLGGRSATAAGVNEHGQVAGVSSIARNGTILRPFRWSRATGMVNLGAIGQGELVVHGINDRGYVYGRASFAGTELPSETHGFFWSPRTGILDIGAIREFSLPTSMNEAGTIVGYAGRGPREVLAFRWSRASGIGDMGTLPDEFTWATHVNNAGQVVGATPFVPGALPHPFLWTPGQGLLDLGVGTAGRGAGTEVTGRGMVIGYLFRDFIVQHGFIWTRETGLIEMGAGNATLRSWAYDVNERGQVVGHIGDRAVVWTRNQGFIDLNTLATGGPARLPLDAGTAISESGAILATSDSGLYLLVPGEGARRSQR